MSAIGFILQFDNFSSDVKTYRTTLQKFCVFDMASLNFSRPKGEKKSGWPKKSFSESDLRINFGYGSGYDYIG